MDEEYQQGSRLWDGQAASGRIVRNAARQGTIDDALWRMERGSSDRYRSLVSDSQAGPPFGTTTGNDLPSTFGAHSFTKTVFPFALEIGRLLICK